MTLIKFFILGVLSALLFPPFFMLPLGFIIFPYLIILLKKISTHKKIYEYFYFGIFYGIGFLLVFLCWIQNPFFTNDNIKNYAIISLFLPIFLSLIFGVGFIFFKYLRRDYYILIFTPFIFLAIEFVISNLFYGFPWVTFALILSNNLLGFYLLKSFGIYVSSYLILIIFILPSLILFSKKYQNIKKLIIFAHFPFIIALIIILIFNKNEEIYEKKINFEVVQIFSPINNPNTKKIEIDIINKVNNSNAEYLVFAENNYPYLISDINNINILSSIKDNKKVIIGSSRLENNKLYNSFLYLEKNNVQVFDKEILVPFGEFLPFRKYLKFMESITGNIDFTPGKTRRLIVTEQINILPVICYEIIFNEILKNTNNNNIDIIINITNDSWFGDKVGPYQHFYHSRMRAIVSNKLLIRVSNNGISAIIDNDGGIIQSSKLNTKTSFNSFVQLKNYIYFKLMHNISEIYLMIIILIYFIFINYKFRYDK